MKAVCLVLSALLAGEIAILAQIGSPYPPNRYPGAGIPMPGRSKKKTTSQDLPPDQQSSYITGKLRRLEENQIVVEAKDTRIVSLKRTVKTKFTNDAAAMKPEALKPGDTLLIEVTQDTEGYLYAVEVIFQKEGTAAERAEAARPVAVSTQSTDGKDPEDERPRLKRADSPPKPEAATADEPEEPAEQAVATAAKPASVIKPEENLPAAPDPDDPGPPKLRRGIPPKRASTRQDTQEIAAAIPPPATLPAAQPAPTPEPEPVVEPDDPVIAKAREAAEGFTDSLPNYICQQFTTRFATTSHVTNWTALDILSAEVVYENGHETYRNLAINGKAVKKKMNELSGAWSTGEFGTVLVDLFHPSTAAVFRSRRDSTTIAGKAATAYYFQVERQNSHWQIQVPSQIVKPAYKGTVWISKADGRVLRIEMQARNVPSEFPLDNIEVATDYDYVRIGGVQQFLLPVHSEMLSCQRDTNICHKNVIEFRNYKKYAGEATITFEK